MGKDSKYSIEELFRKKIEETEIKPGDQLERHFMRRLGRKEFVRFNYARFNIWYLGALIAAATIIGVLLLPAGNSDTQKILTPDNRIIADSSNIIDSSPVSADESDSTTDPALEQSTIKEAREEKAYTPETVVKHETPVFTDSQPENDKHYTVIDLNSTRGSSLLVARIHASANQGCVPLNVNFKNSSSAFETSSWDFGDGGTSDEQEPEWMFNVPGTYRVSLTVKDNNGHSAVTSIIINVWPKPEAAFDILPSAPDIPKEEITFTNNSVGASYYKWHFGDGVTSNNMSPVHKYEKYGKYDVSLVAVSEFGCVDSLSINDAYSNTDCYIRFPNAFTPNTGGPTGGYYSRVTDNASIIFHPVFSGVIKYNLKVYSKQGYLVFESNDIYLGWDGYYKGQLCASGVYIWKAEGKFRDGESYVISGDVTLVNY